MIEDTQPSAIPLQLVRATLEMLRAYIGALIRIQDANYADVVVGYDRTRKRVVNGLALMPVLWLAQREFGWLSPSAQRYVAELMELPQAWVDGVVSFMIPSRPPGRSPT